MCDVGYTAEILVSCLNCALHPNISRTERMYNEATTRHRPGPPEESVFVFYRNAKPEPYHCVNKRMYRALISNHVQPPRITGERCPVAGRFQTRG